MNFYHGTSLNGWNNIRKKGINADINKNTELDFGKGFYASYPEDISYAKKHALKVTREILGKKDITSNAVIIEFEIDESLFENVLTFTKKDHNFLDFVFNTRLNYLNEDIMHDVVSGPMADGTVDSLMSFYICHKSSITAFIVKLCYWLPFNMHKQIVFKTQSLCDNINIISVKNLKGEIIYEQKETNR